MAKARLQKQFKTGSDYTVEGVTEKIRRVRFKARLEIDGVEYLLFQPVYSIPKKAAPKKKRKTPA